MNTKFHLDQAVANAFYGRFSHLRDIQKATINPILCGLNVILTSGTGSGKTEAVMAPLISKYWRQAILNNTLFILYIAPTKALVNDLEKRLYSPLSSLGLRVGIRHGDRDDLISSSPPHILITTPESLEVLLHRKDKALLSIKAVVIDEIHLLYNTQRGLQISISLQRLMKNLLDKPQFIMLSATIGELKYIRDFFFGNNENTVLLSYNTTRVIDAHIRHIPTLKDFVALIHKLTEGRNTKLLIFTNSRRECERLAGALQSEKSLKGFIYAHYSSLSPEVRIENEKKFSSMRTAICVATSTLELGIDIGDINVVLLWGIPSGVDSFLQRIGRGNRRSNKTNVVCLIPDYSNSVLIDALQFAALIDAASKGDLPTREPYELFGAFSQQCINIIDSHNGQFIRIKDLCDLVSHKSYFSREIIESILAELASKGFLQHHSYKNQYGADQELYRISDMKLIYGNFGIGSQTINLYYRKKLLGEIPIINLLRLRRNSKIRFAGKCWRVINILKSEGIYLDPTPSTTDVIDLTYGGNAIPSDPFVINRTWELLHSKNIPINIFSRDLQKKVVALLEEIQRICSINQIPTVKIEDMIIYFTFAGSLVNRAVGLYTGKTDFKADNISLQVSSPINWTSIPNDPLRFEEFFPVLFESNSEQSIYQKMLPLHLQEREFIQHWVKDKEISKILNRLSQSNIIQIKDSSIFLKILLS
jgi:ATP-dependent Lhr-like helicase